MRNAFLLVALAALAVVGCGESDSGSGRHVVAAFYPLAYAAERVAPGAHIQNLTPAGSEPHDLELSARDVEAVEDADLVLYLGDGFMPAVEAAAEGNENAVDVLEGLELRAGDPHVWLDPMRYAAIARTIEEALGEPGAADELVAQLEALDAQLRDGLETCERRQIVTSHAAFGYLAEAYDLEQVPLTGISPEAEPSARDVEALVDDVREAGATTVFFETLVSPRLAATVAREAGAKTAVLNPLEGLTEDELAESADYFSVMRENLAALREALGCT